jgi:hypothetical protein
MYEIDQWFENRVRNKKYIIDNRTYKWYNVRKWLSCPICPPNRGENYSNQGKDKRSWKRYRKTQYKI